MDTLAERKKVERERRMQFARHYARQVWKDPACSGKTEDVELTEAFAKLLCHFIYIPHLGCATSAAMIRELRARPKGHPEYVTISQDVEVHKVLEAEDRRVIYDMDDTFQTPL